MCCSAPRAAAKPFPVPSVFPCGRFTIAFLEACPPKSATLTAILSHSLETWLSSTNMLVTLVIINLLFFYQPRGPSITQFAKTHMRKNSLNSARACLSLVPGLFIYGCKGGFVFVVFWWGVVVVFLRQISAEGLLVNRPLLFPRPQVPERSQTTATASGPSATGAPRAGPSQSQTAATRPTGRRATTS